MPHTKEYAAIGKWCVGKHDWHTKGRTNVIGALPASCLLTVSLFTGSINANVFVAWVEQYLLLKLPPHCVIVIDNATFHKRMDIQKIIQEAGYTLEYLPAYSPDLNPIEYKWAQSKAIRKQRHCSVYDLFKRLLF